MTITQSTTTSFDSSDMTAISDALATVVANADPVLGTVERLSNEFASAAFVSMVSLGDRLGLYQALDEIGAATAATLAAHTGMHERLLLEWLSSNASAGYMTYDASDETFVLSPGASEVLARQGTPMFIARAAGVIRSYYADEDLLAAAFESDGSVAWGDHHDCMFTGVERFFAAAYDTNLLSEWIPSIPGLAEKLTHGARVADVGCGHGVSTALMADAFPRSQFFGFDFHDGSIDRARQVAADAGVMANTHYDVKSAVDYDGPFDVICFYDALHDMGDPEAAIRHARANLADDGIVLLVEMQAGDDRTASIANPISRWFYAASTALCTPCALAQDGPLALGNQVGRQRWNELFEANGFSRFELALETPFNLILEARP